MAEYLRCGECPAERSVYWSADSGGQGDVLQARWGTHGDHAIIALHRRRTSGCFLR